MSNGTGPKQVYLIRHGEKPGDASSDKDGGINLSIRGSARAAALPSLFVPATTQLGCLLVVGSGSFTGSYVPSGLAGNPPPFETPDFIFATKQSSNSNRPVETITPASIALALSYDDKHSDRDYPKVATDILTNAKYVGKTVLVCWHHGNLPSLAGKLGVAKPPCWPGRMFDRVWQITYANGAATLTDLPQMLLFGDSST